MGCTMDGRLDGKELLCKFSGFISAMTFERSAGMNIDIQFLGFDD